MQQVAVIMAGGSGTRLWPLSRRGRPKQLLRLLGGKSLLRLSYERLLGTFPNESICVIAGAEHLAAIAVELPELPPANLIGEPCGRDTANAVALAAAIVQVRWPGATMGVFTADHVISPVERFTHAVRGGFSQIEAHPDVLVTFGIVPAGPSTGMGYIRRGEALGVGVHRVRQFKEKPDEPTARAYLASGEYCWNSGMFAWRCDTILEHIQRRLPETFDVVMSVASEWESERARQRLTERYPRLTRISIDFAVMEHAENVLVVDMDVIWHDLGSWTALRAVQQGDAAGNIVAGEVVALNAHHNVFVSEGDHLVAAMGVSDLVVVHSRDATLICRAADAQRLKELLAEIERRHGDRYA